LVDDIAASIFHHRQTAEKITNRKFSLFFLE